MEWISKDQPIYVWEGDTWYNERDKLTYFPDLINQCWSVGLKINEPIHYFTKKTRIMKKSKLEILGVS